uniref:Uncharacterized protein ycf36 n=1 Tax=Rhizophora mucronata TaxID=61149 RepID=A0A2P2K4B9_RHIMU
MAIGGVLNNSSGTPNLLLSPIIHFTKPRRIHQHQPHRRKNMIPGKAIASYKNGSNSRPETGCPVPLDQQPINEYQNLSTSFPFSWAAADFVEYCSRLFATGASFALFVGLPVAWFGSFGAESEPLKRVLAATSSGVFAVSLAVLRMYLGWAYVGNRLLSATVEYEETGWYDGQVNDLYPHLFSTINWTAQLYFVLLLD